jgi:glutamate 5-kinase
MPNTQKPKVDHVPFQDDVSGYFRHAPVSDFKTYDGRLIAEPSDRYMFYSKLSGYNTIVVKLGTNIVAHKDSRRMIYNMKCIAQDLAAINNERGMNVMLVSSGAIGLGRKLRIRRGDVIQEKESRSPEQKQRDAFEGQPLLYTLWQHHLYPQLTEESLVTHEDISNPEKRERLFEGYRKMLCAGKIPVINEDDKRSIEEIEIKKKGKKIFPDNDHLASLIAAGLNDHGYKTLLVILSTTDGIYTAESCENGEFQPIRVVQNSSGLEEQVFFTTSNRGRGGMESKIMASRYAAANGVPVIIANGQYCNHDAKFQNGHVDERKYRVLEAILNGDVVGTRFLPKYRS